MYRITSTIKFVAISHLAKALAGTNSWAQNFGTEFSSLRIVVVTNKKLMDVMLLYENYM